LASESNYSLQSSSTIIDDDLIAGSNKQLGNVINDTEFEEYESDEGCDSVDDLDSKDCMGQSRQTYQDIRHLLDKGE
jgi:hypothetical protein